MDASTALGARRARSRARTMETGWNSFGSIKLALSRAEGSSASPITAAAPRPRWCGCISALMRDPEFPFAAPRFLLASTPRRDRTDRRVGCAMGTGSSTSDSHVTPSLEVLHRYAGKAVKERWHELDALCSRDEVARRAAAIPKEPWHTIKVNPIPYNRIAGQKPGEEKAEKGGAGAVEGRVVNISTDGLPRGHPARQPDRPARRHDLEGVDVNRADPRHLGAGIERARSGDHHRALRRLSHLHARFLQRRYQPPQGAVSRARQEHPLGGRAAEEDRARKAGSPAYGRRCPRACRSTIPISSRCGR